MIVELTGAPGVGKTTIFERLRADMGGDAVFFSRDVALARIGLAGIPGRWLRIAATDTMFIFIGLANTRGALAFIRQVVGAVLSTQEPLRVKLNILRNTLLKIGRHHFIWRYLADRLVVIDEGLSHVPFNIADYTCNRVPDPAEVLSPIEDLTRQLNVALIDNSGANLATTLALRGHSRLNSSASYGPERFAAVCRVLAERYRAMPTGMFATFRVFDLAKPEAYNCVISYLRHTEAAQ